MENNLDIEKFKEISRGFVIDIIYSARNSHEKAFEGSRERNDLIAGIILNNGISAFNPLKILCFPNPDVENVDLEDFLQGFMYTKKNC